MLFIALEVWNLFSNKNKINIPIIRSNNFKDDNELNNLSENSKIYSPVSSEENFKEIKKKGIQNKTFNLKEPNYFENNQQISENLI